LGKHNSAVDALSRPEEDDVQQGEKEISLIPPEAFINVFDVNSEGTLESDIVKSQQ
jgi:hypothetical protein